MSDINFDALDKTDTRGEPVRHEPVTLSSVPRGAARSGARPPTAWARPVSW